MPDADHIKAFRLFDLSKAETSGERFQLADWESEHLRQCAECQGVAEVFARQFRQRPRFVSNGEVNTKERIYRSVCCGLQLFVPTGVVFPDCRRHKNLPTVWKGSTDEPIPHARDLD